MKEVMKREMAKHDENGVMAVFPVLGRPRPVLWGESAQSADQIAPVGDIALQRVRQVQFQQEIVWIRVARVVGRDDRGRRLQHLVEPFEKDVMHVRKVARVFVD